MCKKKGFTLTEVVVVAAIVALLAALVFPLTAGARERARQSVCIQQLRGFHQALSMYGADHPGY